MRDREKVDPPSSVRRPATSSDSASERSKGARPEDNKRPNQQGTNKRICEGKLEVTDHVALDERDR